MAKNTSTDRLTEFIRQQIKARGISLRTAAKGIGVSAPFLSNVLSKGKGVSVRTCNQIADYFQVPRVRVYEMMGWVDLIGTENKSEEDANLKLLFDLVASDADFWELVNCYTLSAPKEKKRICRVVKAMVEE